MKKNSFLRLATLAAVLIMTAVTGTARQTNPNPPPVAPDAGVSTRSPADSPPADRKKKSNPNAGVPFRGEVGAVNSTAMTVTLTGKKKERVMHLTPETRLERDGKPAAVADIKPGDYARGSYHKDAEGKEVLLKVSLGDKPAASGKSGSGASEKTES